jgi:hypothetical protein
MRDPFEALALALGGSPGPSSAASGGPPLTLDEQARLVGGYQWAERRLFEVLGAWVESEPQVQAQVLFDIYSQQHAWHAELLSEWLPVRDGVEPGALVLPPTIEIDRLLATLSGTRADGGRSGTVDLGSLTGEERPAGGTLFRLAGVTRVVLPRLIAGYQLHLQRVAPVADAPLARCLRLVLRDEVEQWQVLELLTQTLVRRPHDVAVVTAHQQRLEEMVAATGPGLMPWPEGAEPDPVPEVTDHGHDHAQAQVSEVAIPMGHDLRS